MDLADDVRPPPPLFIHGICSGAWSFAEHWLPAAVDAGFPAYALSFRGHGGSAGGDRLMVSRISDPACCSPG
jgi:pimeloyl-ACP methyl ester carboxylesterase